MKVSRAESEVETNISKERCGGGRRNRSKYQFVFLIALVYLSLFF